MKDWSLLGSPHTGLVGPFAFPDRYTFERRVELDKSARKRARRMRAACGSVRGVPLYIEAVVPPLKILRGLLVQLATIVDIHSRDIGHAMLYEYFPGEDEEACIDFSAGEEIESCPRLGTRAWFSRWRRWLWARYAELQVRALDNGRYFPPPRCLRVYVPAEGPLRVEVAYAHGFLPGDRRYVWIAPTEGSHGRWRAGRPPVLRP